MRIINRGLLFSLIPALAFSAPFLCRNNNATYQVSAHCNTACGTTCEELDPLTSGTSGTCDTSNYEGFVYFNNKTYAISKATKFWTDIPNLAQPATSEINDVIKGIAGYYGGNGWIGVYDPLKSNNYNAIDPSRFKLTGGIDMVYTNWKSGQPDNKLDNADIGVTAINGEHWAYIQADSTWLDDGYHVLYGGDYKPRRKALTEWNGPLDCVNGTPKPTTSDVSGYWCGDGAVTFGKCISTTDYTAKTGSSYTYAATVGWTGKIQAVAGGCSPQILNAPGMLGVDALKLYWDINGVITPNISNPILYKSYNEWKELCANAGTYDPLNSGYGCGGGLGSSCVAARKVMGYSCTNGGTLSGSTCTVNTLACPTGYTATSGAETAKGECKKTVGPTCPLGDYQCVDVTGGVENTDTIEGSNDKTDNGETDASGNCLGQIYIFNGGDNRCRPSGIQTGFTDCCRKGTTWFGLGQCRESEKALGKLREFGSLDGNCHYIGDYCAEKWPLIGCVQKKKTYCCFSSPLARIIHEDGRPQLGIGWGSPESPQCRGFTPEEFQKIDFSKVDFSEWVNLQVIPNVQNGAIGNIQNVINNIDTNLAP